MLKFSLHKLDEDAMLSIFNSLQHKNIHLIFKKSEQFQYKVHFSHMKMLRK